MIVGKRSRTVFLLLALGACSSENGVDPDATMSLPPPDSGYGYGCLGESLGFWLTTCNPVTQAGCSAGEKCAELTVVADDEATPANEHCVQIACVPDGNVAEGDECADGSPGQDTGFDDCVYGYDCFQDVCMRVCGSSPDTCHTDPPAPAGLGESCANNIPGHFNDTTGVCFSEDSAMGRYSTSANWERAN